MYVVYINLLYFCRFFCLLTIKIFFPKKKIWNSTSTVTTYDSYMLVYFTAVNVMKLTKFRIEHR